MPAIQLDHISKQFTAGSTPAVADISFTVEAGEFVCVVGPSGCGKSTLFNLIAGLDKPTSGSITTTGKIGFMFQESALFPWLTVERNVAFGLRVAKQDNIAIEHKVTDLLELVQLKRWAKSYPHELSGGMRQRVALARTLALDPDIILMDEPFSALDAQTREDLHEQLQQLWQATKKTIVFITHDIREACFLSDRVIAMKGRPGAVVKMLENRVARPRSYFDPQLDALALHIKQLL